jgi:hypothetical protein
MNSLVSASSLVPSRKELIQPLEDQISSIGLDKLITTLILPPDEESYTTNLVSVVQHFKKKDDVPTKEITTEIVESFREYYGLKQKAEGVQREGIDILQRLASWGVKRVVKWMFKTAFRLMLRFTRWVFDKIIRRGVTALIDWVVRPILTVALDFLGINVELWPFIAIAGGVAGIGIVGWNMFFSKPKESKVTTVASKADSLLTDPKLVEEGIEGAPLEPITVATDGTRAVAPVAAGSTAEASSVGALISRGEGTYNSVNLGAAHGYKAATVDLVNMTVSEVMAHQQAQDFNAVGKYQIIKSTLYAAVKDLGISGDTKFDAALQDRIFNQYLIGTKRRAIGDYISGKSNDLTAAILAASQEWASVAAPPGAHTQSGAISDGTISYYSGVANNKASITADEMAKSLMASREQNNETTQVASDKTVKQNPGVTVAQNQNQQQQTSQSSPTAVPIRTASNTQKNYIKGPQGSIVAVS